MKNKKILILGNSHLSVFGLRGELISKLIENDYDVTVSFPNGPFGTGEESSKEYGCKFVETELERRGTNLFTDLKLIIKYIRLIKKEKPDVVLAYTVKCDVYGGIACRITNTLFIPNITGLGKGLADGGITSKLLVLLYRISIKESRIVYFQNKSDYEYFKNGNIKFKRYDILPGSGVNVEKYKPLEYPNSPLVVFTYIARVMKTKGIDLFLNAANVLKGKAEFHVCGFCEEDYEEIINKAQEAGIIKYHGLVKNIIDYERFSSCIVLPSFHPEGISNVLLEAAACARPIITTDHPGCREVVDDGVNGYLVKKQDSEDLIKKMEMFLKLPQSKRIAMGINGHKKVIKEFSREIVVNKYIDEIRRSSLKS